MGGKNPISDALNEINKQLSNASNNTNAMISGAGNNINRELSNAGNRVNEYGQGIVDSTQGTIDTLSGQTAKDLAAEETKRAKEEQAKREADLAEQEKKNQGQRKSASMRARQKALSGGGRQGTILTEGLGGAGGSGAASGGGKTLLGS